MPSCLPGRRADPVGLPVRAALFALRDGPPEPSVCYLPKQPGDNKRMRALAPQIVRLLNTIAFRSPSWCDNVRLLDSTPVPCAASRGTVRRSGHAGYGWCASHSRYFWGFRLYLLCAPDGMPIAFELAPANAPEREVAAELLRRVELEGYTVIADKGFADEGFEALMSELGALFCAPIARTSRAALAGWAACASGSSRSSTRSRASSRSSATGPTRCRASSPASPSACWPSPPVSGTTGVPAIPGATSLPTITESAETESFI